MAILHPFLCPDPSSLRTGGRWPVDLAVALGRLADPWDVDLVSFGTAGRYPLGERATLVLLEPHRTDVSADRSEDVLSWDLPEALEGADAVVVHQPFSRAGEVACLVARALGKPIVAIDGGARSSTVGRSLGLLGLVDQVICPSAYGASLLAPGTPTVTVPGGVDHRAFSPPPAALERTHLLFCGRPTAHSGVDQLIEALPAGLPLVVCSRPGSDPGPLRELAEGRDVSFEPAVEEGRLLHLYRTAWATVVPSVEVDGSGAPRRRPVVTSAAALESMACATPAVVTAVGALPELVDDGRTGWVTGSVGQAAERAAALAGDPPLVERLGREARQAVVDRFTMDAVAEAVGTLLGARVGGREVGAA